MMENSPESEFISDVEAQKILGLTSPINPSEEWYAKDPNRRKRIVKIRARVPKDDPQTGDVIWEPQETGVGLACDDIRLGNLILGFYVVPYNSDGEIAHEVFKNPYDPEEWIEWSVALLKFKRVDVESLKAIPGWHSTEPTAPEHQVKRLEVRRSNILMLQQSRDQLALGPSNYLRESLAETERQIAAFSKLGQTVTSAKKKTGVKHQTATQAHLKKLLPVWKREVAELCRKFPEMTISRAYRNLTRKKLTLDPSGEEYSENTFRIHVKKIFPDKKWKGGRPRGR